MTWPPAAAKLVVNVAVPPVPTATIPRTTLPSAKVTVPVGVPAPGATAATAAVKVTAWPVNYRTGAGSGVWLEISFPVRLQEFEWGTREWLGLFAYWLMGRTDALFPAP